MIGPFPPSLHRKTRKYVKYSRVFLYCLDEKSLAQNCFARKKRDFLRRARRKAQEYWICIPSIFNDVRREKILFALPYPYSVRPKGLSVCFARGRLFGAASFCPAALLRSGTAVLYNSRIRAPGGLSPPGKRTKQREAAPCILWRQRAF